MDLGYFRPNRQKILNALFILAVVAGFAVVTLPSVEGVAALLKDAPDAVRALLLIVLFPIFILSIIVFIHPFNLFRAFPFLVAITAMILAYGFGCYLSTTQKKQKVIVTIIACAAALALTCLAILVVVDAYNNAYGHSCTTDTDCELYHLTKRGTCQFVANKQYINIDREVPGVVMLCAGDPGKPVCNKRNFCDTKISYPRRRSPYCDYIQNSTYPRGCCWDNESGKCIGT